MPFFSWRGGYELPFEGERIAALPALSTTQASLLPSLASPVTEDYFFHNTYPSFKDQDL